jgi:hypothetical protein
VESSYDGEEEEEEEEGDGYQNEPVSCIMIFIELSVQFY